MASKEYMLILAIVLFVLFLVAVIMSLRTWRVHTVIMMSLVFIAAMIFFTMASMTLKTHQSWREIIVGKAEEQRAGGLQPQTEKLLKESDHLVNGVVEKGKVVKKGFRQLDREWRVWVEVRGRRWENCIRGTPDAATGKVKVEVPAVDPAAIASSISIWRRRLGDVHRHAEPFSDVRLSELLNERPTEIATAVPNQIEADTIVYVFDSKKRLFDPDKGEFVGGEYLGEFKVAEVEAAEPGEEEEAGGEGPAISTVSLEPNWIISPAELGRLSQSAKNWTIYDRMAVDDHYSFNEIESIKADEIGIPPAERNDIARPDILKRFLPAASVKGYIRDRQPATEDDPRERVEVFVEFNKEYVYPSPSIVGKIIDDKGEREFEVKFEKGHQAWIRKVTVTDPKSGAEIDGADALIENKFAKPVKGVEPRYVRALRDYVYLYHEMYLARRRQADAIQLAIRRIEDTERVISETKLVVKGYEKTKLRLENDTTRHDRDETVITAHYNALRKQGAAAFRKMQTLRRQNAEIAAQIEKYQMKAAEVIDRRAQATSQASLPPAGGLPK